MTRLVRFLGPQVGAVLGATLLVSLVGGCPSGFDLSTLFGPVGGLTVTASTSGETTVDKTINLAADISGGTAPYTAQWTQLGGPPATITGADTANATFTPTAAGVYTFGVDAQDSASTKRAGTAEVEVPVGDIQFVVEDGSFVVVAGNPALLRTGSRSSSLDFETRIAVSDPKFTNRSSFVLADGAVDPANTDEINATFDLVSVPTGAQTQDVTVTQSFITLTNLDWYAPGPPIEIRPNPNATFKALTNIGTTVDNFGSVAPGAYVFRATATNPDGVQRTRDLTVTVTVEGIDAVWGGSSDGSAVSAGPTAVKVKELPQGSPGRVTDKVMTPSQTAAMTVTVFPTTPTTYRFFLTDNNGVAHPEAVTQSAATVTPTGAPQDIALTIGLAAGLPIGTHSLSYESFDGYGNVSGAVLLTVNSPAVAVRFHVTKDYLAASTINAALVGGASNDVDAPTDYEGWSGEPDFGGPGSYGPVAALADVNLDGALDVLTIGGDQVRIKTDGFRDGSAAALRHPQNNGSFGPRIGEADNFAFGAGSVRDPKRIAVGDLNGDGFPDVVLSQHTGGGPDVGYVRIFFHTGDPAQPYSQHDDQTLTIFPPTYERRFRALDGLLTTTPVAGTPPTAPGRDLFGYQIAVAPVFGGDNAADLIITDPGFTTMQVYGVDPNNVAPAPLAKNWYNAGEGRVYVFKGGATGELKPNQPDIVTSEIIETGVTDVTPLVASVDTPAETNKKYDAVYAGNAFDFIGYSLAANSKGFAVGSPLAWADGLPFTTYTLAIVDGPRVANATTVTTTTGGVSQTYEFRTTGDATPPNVKVDISAANADLPANALVALTTAINADPNHVVTAAANPKDPEQLILTSIFSGLDSLLRGGGFTQNRDGIVYRVAANTATGTALSNPVKGTKNSSMGLGAEVAKGNLNGTGADDLLIAALDSGDGLGVNGGDPLIEAGDDDGAVFFVFDDGTTLVAITGVGANTGLAPEASTIAQTAVGARVAIANVTGDTLDDAFFSEPGFDHVYMIKGAAAPATTPTITFTGVTFTDGFGSPPTGSSLGNSGSFLFGDITGDTELDWLFLDSSVHFGFAGFKR